MARRKAPTFAQLKDEYTHLWETCKIKPSAASTVVNAVTRLKSNEARYRDISERCGGNIPWEFIAVIHSLESNQNFDRHLHNGDSLRSRTRRVPAGRPKVGSPPFTFEESAVDALKMKGYHKIRDWSIERMLYEMERYNGWGYRLYHPSVLTPYLWAGSPHYTRGKYVADGKWSSTAVSAQGGGALKLKLLEAHRNPRKHSRKERTAFNLEWLIPGAAGGSVLSWSFLENVKQFMSDNAGIMVLVMAGITIAIVRYFKHRQRQDMKNGNYIPSELVTKDEEDADNR